MNFFDNVGKKLSGASQTAISKTKQVADNAKYSAMIVEEERNITKLYQEIGKHYFETYGENLEEQVKETAHKVTVAKEKIADYKAEIQKIKGITLCPNCGNEVPKGAAFCSSCGAAMPVTEPEAETGFCGACGAELKEGASFCTVCGAKVEPVGEAFMTTFKEVENSEENTEEKVEVFEGVVEDTAKDITEEI